MNVLHDIVNKDPFFASMQISDKNTAKAKLALDKGIDCIIKTQRVSGTIEPRERLIIRKPYITIAVQTARNGLYPNNAEDRNKVAGDGYTILEK